MTDAHVFPRRFDAAWMLAGALALIVAPPSSADAKSLCFSQSVNADDIVLVNPKIKRGKVTPVTGFVRISSHAQPLAGTSIVNASGRAFAIALRRANAAVTGAVASFSGGDDIPYLITFNQIDGKLDEGDSGTGLIGNTQATFTIVDCESAPGIP